VGTVLARASRCTHEIVRNRGLVRYGPGRRIRRSAGYNLGALVARFHSAGPTGPSADACQYGSSRAEWCNNS